MLGKILTRLRRLDRKWSYLVASFLAMIVVILTDLQPLQSTVLPESARSVYEPTEHLVDLEKFSGMVANLEEKWEGDYERYFNRNFSHSSRSANKIAKRLTEIKEQANINPAVIWAVPKDDFLLLMLVTPERQFITKKIRGANRDRLTKRITELEAGIADRHSLEYYPPARLIYNWLFKPLDPYLEAEGIDTLLLCTGPNLRSLPFSVLHDGEQYAIEKYNLARIPAFSLTDTSYTSQPNKEILAMGASEFADLPSLPGVQIEIDSIVPELWSGQKMLNQEFTLSNFEQAHKMGNFDIVHIASHAQFVPGSPKNSFIQFSDRKMTLDRLTELELDTPQVDLLVLSSCETALGDKDAEFGFAGLAIQTGAKSALASLWKVNDVGTVVLMSEFYHQLQSNPIKSAALRKAQLNMLKKNVYVEGAEIRGSRQKISLPENLNESETENFNHPFYWAGFTVIGNPW